jgi:arylamine N-acetyltransferase
MDEREDCDESPIQESSDFIDHMSMCGLRDYAKRLRREAEFHDLRVNALTEQVRDLGGRAAAAVAHYEVSEAINQNMNAELMALRERVAREG